MPTSPATLAALRSLLAARFPEKTRKPERVVPTGLAAVDEALGGGLATGRLTELVAAAPSSGGQLVLAGLLAATRTARQRVALVDAADGFVPESVPADELRHLVWVRGRGAAEALAAGDLLVRDGNYTVIVLDLRGLAGRVLQKQPATVWYRLQRAAEGGAAAVLVLTPYPLVPAVPWRLVLRPSLSLERARQPRAAVAAGLTVEVERSAGRQNAVESEEPARMCRTPLSSERAICAPHQAPIFWLNASGLARISLDSRHHPGPPQETDHCDDSNREICGLTG